MKILLTGGDGFIGRNIREALSGRYAIDAPSSGELDLLDEDAVSSRLSGGRYDVVIHAATWNATRNSRKDRSRALAHNLRMFLNLEKGKALYGKMICFGSGAEYDMRHYRPRMKESDFGAHVPADDYGLSKYLIARIIENAGNIFNLRLFGVFGKYEDWEIRFISNASCKALFDLPITIRQNVCFDYTSVDDVVEITEWFVRNDPGHRCYNVCASRPVDLLTLAKRILRIAGKDLDIRVSREGLGTEYSGDNSLLLGEMPGRAFRDLDGCISALYAWYAERRDTISRDRLLVDK